MSGTDRRGVPAVELRMTLLEHAVALTRRLGPSGVSLREVQRLSGVSPAAAYRHYRDRQALLTAVGRYASAQLADAIQQAFDALPAAAPSPQRAITRLRVGIAAYLAFARAEPGLYRSILLTQEHPADLENPPADSRGSDGVGPYQLLRACIEDLVTQRLLPRRQVAWSDTTVWAASHGLAMLSLDGPLRFLDNAQQRQAQDRLIDVIINGLAETWSRRPAVSDGRHPRR